MIASPGPTFQTGPESRPWPVRSRPTRPLLLPPRSRPEDGSRRAGPATAVPARRQGQGLARPATERGPSRQSRKAAACAPAPSRACHGCEARRPLGRRPRLPGNVRQAEPVTRCAVGRLPDAGGARAVRMLSIFSRLQRWARVGKKSCVFARERRCKTAEVLSNPGLWFCLINGRKPPTEEVRHGSAE